MIGPAATPTGDAASAPTPTTIPQEVALGQHLSASGSYTETEIQAARPMLCQIQRDTCAFQQVVIVRDPNILFSESQPPPYGAQDRI